MGMEAFSCDCVCLDVSRPDNKELFNKIIQNGEVIKISINSLQFLRLRAQQHRNLRHPDLPKSHRQDLLLLLAQSTHPQKQKIILLGRTAQALSASADQY